MKKISLLLSAVIFLSFFNAVSAAEKIAVIDVQEVVAKSAEVQALKKEQEKNMDALQKWLKTVRADMEKQSTEEGKAKLAKKYEAEYIKKQEAMRKSYTEKLKVIDKNINATIAEQAKAKGYDMIIAKGVVIYGGDDITADIVKAVRGK